MLEYLDESRMEHLVIITSNNSDDDDDDDDFDRK